MLVKLGPGIVKFKITISRKVFVFCVKLFFLKLVPQLLVIFNPNYFKLLRLTIDVGIWELLWKILSFWQFLGIIFVPLGVKDIDYSHLSKLFWPCLVSVKALFLTSKGLLLIIFSATKVDKWHRKFEILYELFPHFDRFLGPKKSCRF